CRAGLGIHPDYISARVTLGRALLALNQLDAAQEELERVLRSAPENLAAIRGLADARYRRGHMAEALDSYRAALSLAQNDPELQQIVARLSHDGEPEATPIEEAFRPAIMGGPEGPHSMRTEYAQPLRSNPERERTERTLAA